MSELATIVTLTEAEMKEHALLIVGFRPSFIALNTGLRRIMQQNNRNKFKAI